MLGLEGKVVMITGGGSGLGQGAAMRFAQEGASVVIADRDIDAGEAVAATIRNSGGQALAIRTDVSDEASVIALIDEIVAKFGRLDCAFNNAGVSTTGVDLVDHTSAMFTSALSVNVMGTFLCMKYEIQQFLRQGHGGAIVNTSSVAGVQAGPGASAYIASKFAVNGMTKSAAIENARHNIRINAIMPGMVITPLVLATTSKEAQAQIEMVTPMRRLGTIEEIANATVWLCSDQAAYITGVALPIDGGLSA